jgi:hypothetical protein
MALHRCIPGPFTYKQRGVARRATRTRFESGGETTMRKRRLVAGMLSAIALLAALCLAPGGVVHAAAQANQEWFGQTDINGNRLFLGNASGGNNFTNYIRSFTAFDMCLGVPLNMWMTPGAIPFAPLQRFDCQPVSLGPSFFGIQIWHQQDNGNGSWLIYLQNDGSNGDGNYGSYCLDSQAGGGGAGSPVLVTRCDTGATVSEEWTIGRQGQLQSVGSPGYCLDDGGSNANNGLPVMLSPCQYD